MTSGPNPAASATERRLPKPLINPEAKPYFDAAGEGRLVYARCAACDKPHHPPRSICPHCFSDDISLRASTGKGRVYSCSVLRRGVPIPYCIAYVTLDEGVTLLSNIVTADLDAVQIDMPVHVRFVESDGGARVPVFVPEL